MLLEVDGLDRGWENGALSIWEGNLGLHDVNDVNDNLPEAIRRLLTPMDLRRYDTTSHVVQPTTTYNQQERNNSDRHQNQQLSRQERIYEINGGSRVRVVKNLSLSYFRSNLVHHFDIAFTKNEVRWPGTQNDNTHQTCETNWNDTSM
jgi:hypothetical protein